MRLKLAQGAGLYANSGVALFATRMRARAWKFSFLQTMSFRMELITRRRKSWCCEAWNSPQREPRERAA